MKNYYVPPSDEIFNEIKEAAIKIWSSYDDTYGYATEKINRIKDITNIKDNALHIYSMFDWENQNKLIEILSAEAKAFISEKTETNDKYILNGKEVVAEPNLFKWGSWLQKANTRVALDEIEGNRVSTVFLGLDYSWGDGDIQVFETMIFGKNGGEVFERYATWDAAEEGHKKAVEKIKEEINNK